MKKLLIWLLGLFLTMVMFVVVLPLLIAASVAVISKGFDDVNPSGKQVVAVIEIQDVITDVKDVLDALYDEAQNAKVSGIVLRIDSPGGSVGPSQDIYSAVKLLKAKKPIIVSMGGVAASGGLYSALAGSKVFAQPGTLTGSIGVILEIPNYTQIANMVGFKMNTVKSGVLKDVGNPFRDMTDEERAFLQTTIDTAYADFVTAVSESRNIPREDVLKFADGRIILGTDAKKLGLVDEFGDVYAASRAVFDVLKKPLPEGQYPHLVYPLDNLRSLRAVLRGASRIESLLNPKTTLSYRAF